MDNLHNAYLAHHGVKGMKWGVRKKYGNDYVSRGQVVKAYRQRNAASQASRRAATQYANSVGVKRGDKFAANANKKHQEYEASRKNYEALKAKRKEQQRDPEIVAQRKATAKKVAKGAAFVAGTAITAYAVNKVVKKKYVDIAEREVMNSIRKGSSINDFRFYRNSPEGQAMVEKWIETGRTNAKNRSFGTAAKGLANYYTDRAGYRIGGTIGSDIVNRSTRFNVPEVPYHHIENVNKRRRK